MRIRNEEIIVTDGSDIVPKHQNQHPDYEYYKKIILSGETGSGCNVSLYEIPPQKSAYPYHYHFQSEEVFYIISGTGLLRTPEGERMVKPGDTLAFPASPKGAHKLTNTSTTQALVYIDFDTYHSPEVSFMPNSNKKVVYGEWLRQIVPDDLSAGYYDGE